MQQGGNVVGVVGNTLHELLAGADFAQFNLDKALVGDRAGAPYPVVRGHQLDNLFLVNYRVHVSVGARPVVVEVAAFIPSAGARVGRFVNDDPFWLANAVAVAKAAAVLFAVGHAVELVVDQARGLEQLVQVLGAAVLGLLGLTVD